MKESHTGFKQHEGEEIITQFSFRGELYPFKASIIIPAFLGHHGGKVGVCLKEMNKRSVFALGASSVSA